MEVKVESKLENPILQSDVLKNIDSNRLDAYLEFSRSACVPGGGFNSEQALEMLYKSDGNVLEATRRLIHNDLNFPIWNRVEITLFEQLIGQHGKNFGLISKDIGTKSVKECVEHYYLRKKTLQRTRITRTTENLNNNNNTSNKSNSGNAILTNVLPSQVAIANQKDPQVATPSSQMQIFPCKVCGRIFEKIKSRSAHMKRHKNEVSSSFIV